MNKFDFRMRVEVDKSSSEVLAVYLQIRTGHAAKVEEVVEGAAFANYDSKGRLLGVELLAPCNVAVFDRSAHQEPKWVKEFLIHTIPRQMALGAWGRYDARRKGSEGDAPARSPGRLAALRLLGQNFFP